MPGRLPGVHRLSLQYAPDEPHAFEPIEVFPKDHIYYPKIELEVKHPETISRTTMIRTRDYKLTLRPDSRSEFYDLKKDPLELHNLIDDRSYAGPRDDLKRQMLEWYIRTSDVVPVGRDRRSLPARPKSL